MIIADDNGQVNSTKEPKNTENKLIKLTLSKKNFEMSSGRTADITATIENLTDNKEHVSFSIKSTFHMQDRDLEWAIKTTGLEESKSKNRDYVGKQEINDLISENLNKIFERTIEIGGRAKKSILLQISTPKGSALGDASNFEITASFLRDKTIYDSDIVSIVLVSTIVAIKTSLGQEVSVAQDLGKKIIINKIDYVYAIMVPSKLKGYIFVETLHPDQILSFVKSVKGIKGVVKGEMNIDEVLHYLTPKPATEGLMVGGIVELIDGPFKGERAKIIEIDATKNNIIVELIEAIVPIPLNVRADSVKLIENAKE
ncbi:MAG: transcription elongation factor Spt5 [Thermoplasmata archaeon]